MYDKLARALVDKIVLPVPTSRGKGVLVSPTIYGNVMLGPTSEDLTDRSATATSETGFEFLLEKGRVLMPELLAEEVTATYAGLRAAIDHPDYLIDTDAEQHYLLVGGIRSTDSHPGWRWPSTSVTSCSQREWNWRHGPICPIRLPCPTWVRPSRGPTSRPTGSPPTRRTAASSASASGSPKARSATPATR